MFVRNSVYIYSVHYIKVCDSTHIMQDIMLKLPKYLTVQQPMKYFICKCLYNHESNGNPIYFRTDDYTECLGAVKTVTLCLNQYVLALLYHIYQYVIVIYLQAWGTGLFLPSRLTR